MAYLGRLHSNTKGGYILTMDGLSHHIDKWDLIIGHPPCTYLCVSGNKHYEVSLYGDKARERMKERYKAIVFFTRLMDAQAEKVAIENPVGIMNGAYRKPDQIVQPYMFGDPFEKKTCLWLKNLPKLEPTNVVEPPPRQVVVSGKTLPRWYSNCGGDRKKARSKTFPGIARAMAEQWG